jgi:hypothetical protein
LVDGDRKQSRDSGVHALAQLAKGQAHEALVSRILEGHPNGPSATARAYREDQ